MSAPTHDFSLFWDPLSMLCTSGWEFADQLFFHKPLLFGNQEAILRGSSGQLSVPVKSAPPPLTCTQTATDLDKGTKVEYLLVLRVIDRVIRDYLLAVGEVFTEPHTLLGTIYFLFSARLDTGN